MSDLERYIIARWAYAIGKDFMNDQEYRVLEDKLRAEGEPLVNKSWSLDECPTELLKKYGYVDWIQQDFTVQGEAESIPNCPDDETLSYYLSSYKDLKRCRLSYKLDGWNIQAHFSDGKFVQAHTRGRGARTQDADILKHFVHDIDLPGHTKITGELIIPNNKWPEYKAKTGNTSQRSSVSSIIANGDFEYAKWICYNIDGVDNVEGSLDKYSLLNNLGYETPFNIVLPDGEKTVAEIHRYLEQFNGVYEYPTDGVVFDTNCFQIALRLNNYSEKVYVGIIKGYKENWGSYGTAFLIEIEPIEVDGAVRTYIPIQNIGNIEENDLRPGTPICFNIRSGVAPVFNAEAQLELRRRLKEKSNA